MQACFVRQQQQQLLLTSGIIGPTSWPAQRCVLRRQPGWQHSQRQRPPVLAAAVGSSRAATNTAQPAASAARRQRRRRSPRGAVRRTAAAAAAAAAAGAGDDDDDAASAPPGDAADLADGGHGGAYLPAGDRAALWLAAIKPPMFSVGWVPVLVGAAAAYAQHGAAAWGRAGCLLLGATSVIAWLNLSNDAFDAATGVDAHKPESFVNLTGSPAGVLLAAKAFLAVGAALLACGLGAAPDARVAPLLAAAVACGYVYQGPPFRLSYKGLGEPLCFAAFGPLATTAFYLALSPAVAAAAAAAAPQAATAPSLLLFAGVPPLVAVLAVLVGLTTTSILFCSHWHQIQGDVRAGKMSPLVRLGTRRALAVLRLAVAGTYAAAGAAAAAGALPLPALAGLAAPSLPAARALLAFAAANHGDAAAIAPLKRFAVRWHIAAGVGLAGGLALARTLATAAA